MTGLGTLLNNATTLAPVPMGIAVSTIMGLCLTAPISSAAIAISLGLEGLAAGAAAVGCAAQMVGFAVASYRENKIGGLVAQGIGTSMLQFGNICRRPQILIAPTLASCDPGPDLHRGLWHDQQRHGRGHGPPAAWSASSGPTAR